MLWLAALAVVGAGAAAADDFTHRLLGRALRYAAGDATWPVRFAGCATTLGPQKCITSFTAWRAENALKSFQEFGDSYSVLDRELTQFPWEKYANTSDEQVGEELSQSTARLLELRPLTFSMLPGYQFQLDVKDGRINVDVHKDDETEGRGAMKKFRKRFLSIVPILLIPGLIMSAILPFVLPALKMMTIGATLINNMAFTGAVFTLLRNNAFSTTHHKKIIYVNDGYKNVKHENSDYHTHTIEDGYYNEVDEEVADGATDVEHVEEAPEEWLAEYYGGEELAQMVPQRGPPQRGPPYRGTRRSEPKKRKIRLKYGM